MNILLINHYAGSTEMGMEFRPYYFAREWVRMGHRVHVIAADYSHLRVKNPKVTKDFQTTRTSGIFYHWIKTGRYEGNGVKRALTMFRFVGKLWLAAKRIAEVFQPDVVITSSTYPLDTYAGQKIARMCGAKLIHEVHDLWPLTLTEIGGMSRSHPFVRLLQMAEDSAYRHSDHVVSLLPAAKEYMVRHGMKPEKFVHIPNGVVLSEWTGYPELPQNTVQVIRKMKQENRFLLCFFGSITKSYTLDYLIEAVKRVCKKEISLLLVGDGNEKERLQELCRGYENIRFLDPVGKKYIPALLEAVDGVYIGALNNRMFRFGICMNKLFDAMMGGKPILYAVHAPNNYIREYQCGISVQAEDVDALEAGLERLITLPERERRQMGSNGKQAAIRYFNYGVLAGKFADVFLQS